MRNIIVDLTPFDEKISLHSYLKSQLDFPFYYGANLDALFDELASTTDALCITLRYPKTPVGAMVNYLPRLLQVFRDAARENYHLKITYEEVS